MGDGRDRLHYKGYVGLFTVNLEKKYITGNVLNSKDILEFRGHTVADAINDFHKVVDDYLNMCEEYHKAPHIFALN